MAPQIFPNGVDGSTGDFLLPAMTLEQFSRATRAQRIDQPEPRGIQSGFDAGDLSDAGWGLILPAGADPAIRESLRKLLRHRRAQATRKDRRRYQELTVLPGETKLKFLARSGAGPGPVDPRRVPFYLLIAGDPESVPYDFQYALGVQRAVGRICFDTPGEYRRYAGGVVEVETEPLPAPRRASFFGVRNDGDPATQASVEHLVEPLVRQLGESCPEWRLSTVLREQATKARLGDLLGGAETPALLFTAGHAVAFAADKTRQRPHQGALVCADWPGPKAWQGRIPESHYFAAEDLAAGANLRGLVTFHFACFSAGTPHWNSFHRGSENGRRAITPRAFAAQLPQRLLAQGGLATIGHVDQAFQQSFFWDEAGSQVNVFASTLKDLMGGAPVGLAMAHFGQRYAEIAADFLFARSEENGASGDLERSRLWLACNDARNYVIVGDPAVRLPSRGTTAGRR